MENQLLIIEMPNYPRKILLSKSRRAKYFKRNDTLPLKYLQKDIINPLTVDVNKEEVGRDKKNNYHKLAENLIWKSHKLSKKREEIRLYDIETKEYIIKNSRVANTERWEVINGQKIYNGLYHPVTRAKIMDHIHNYMLSFLEGILSIPIECYPIKIDCELHDNLIDPISGKNWDVDNRSYPYMKAFMDCLQTAGIIVKDSVEYVRKPPIPEFIPLEEGEFPRFLFKILRVK